MVVLVVNYGLIVGDEWITMVAMVNDDGYKGLTHSYKELTGSSVSLIYCTVRSDIYICSLNAFLQ